MLNKRLSAYPLFINDPYFSVWSPSDTLNGADTCFWTSLERKTYGIVWVNEKAYSFMGVVPGTIALEQNSVTMNAFSTDYIFECEEFVLEVSFVSPLLPTDLELLSRPVCYMTYRIIAKEELNDYKVVLVLDQQYCYNKCDDTIIGGGFSYPDYELAFFGRNRQLPMSNSFDSTAADWGYTYLGAQTAFYTEASALETFIKSGIGEYVYTSDEAPKILMGINTHDVKDKAEGKFIVAFDEVISIFHYGDWLKGYYFRDGKTIFDAIEEAYKEYDKTLQKIKEFSAELEERLRDYDEEYRLLCMASLRQTMGGHKLVEDKNGNILFLSKECHSNGCVATVDITYPSMPLFLMYNPELILGMIRPVFEFARMPVWSGKDFAPHDCGTYPYVLGQMYALKCRPEENDKYNSNQFRRDRWNGIVVTHPQVYKYPKQADIYVFENQMPIEECSNMMIIAYSVIRCGGNDELIRENYDLLKTWYQYMERSGLIPHMQLCTDDFAERIDENVNLSVKAMVGIKCFSLIAERFGYMDDKALADDCLEKYRKQYYDLFNEREHQPLSYNGNGNTYSLKYNMAYDVLYDFGLFSEEMREKEIDFYLKQNTHLGVPLDHRSDLTKTDWILYTCTLTEDRLKQKQLYSAVVNFLDETPDRVPFSDLYHVQTGKIKDFQNRTVQGGIFILLLKDMLRTQKN